MSPFVKICGICSRSDLEQISALKPNALGFILWEKSKRYIAPEAVGQWETPPNIQRVGVFVNPSEAELRHATKTARLDVLQLHRVSSHWKINRANFQGLEIWRALSPEEVFSHVTDHESRFKFDRLLLDSYDPKTVGGTGQTCNWDQARKIVQSIETPILLAGGLSSDNVAEAIHQVQPWGIDVSSSVEIEPGTKDIAKVKAFISACRAS